MKTYIKLLLISLLLTDTLFALSIDTNKDAYAKGESITVSVTGMRKARNCKDGSRRRNDCNWVGLFYADDSSKPKHLLTYQYAGKSSSQVFTFRGLNHRGDYEARVFYYNNYNTRDRSSFSVIDNAQDVQIKTQKETYTVGEPITVDVTGLAGNDDDWLGIFYAFDDNKERHVVRRIETGGQKQGTFTLPALHYDGEYEVRAFFNGSFDEKDYYPFEVVEGAVSEAVIINEVLASNAHKNVDPDFSKFSDWIELYNQSGKSVNIGGYKLSDKLNNPKWTIPSGTILKSHEYMLFWADEKDTSLLEHHTNFKLKDKGEAVALFDRGGQLIDSIEFGQQEVDISIAKDGGAVGFMYPTPKKENWDIHSQSTLSAAPQFSKAGGFYTGSVAVSLSASNGADIYYTTDGSYPTYGSRKYRSPISIYKTTVLRVMSVEDGKFQSKRVTNTYFINENTTLPIISLTTDSEYLWDDMIGIYTVGRNGAEKICSAGNANYMQDWKRPANIEYFGTDKNLGFSQEVDISVSGTCTRELAQKSLNIKADSIYGKKRIEYKLFKEKNIAEFKSFKLRNSGQDWWKTMFRDAMIQQLAKDGLNVDYQAYEPCVVFLNGKYWGIHNIREKKNEDYLANNYANLDADNINILYRDQEVKEGKSDDYTSLINYLKTHELSNDANYNYVASKIDINNYIDYQSIQIYSANFDWPGNNIRYWKEEKAGTKWRWMMDDQDAGFNLFAKDSSPDPETYGLYHNTLRFASASNSVSWRNAPWSTFLFRKLLENDAFKTAFKTRYEALLTSTFAPNRVKSLINRMKDVIAPEMPKHIQRWGSEGPDYHDIGDWYDNIDVMLDFADKRPDIAKGHLDAF